jgi:hypothetical protein
VENQINIKSHEVFPHGSLYINHGFSNPCAVNKSSFSKISLVSPSATTRPSSITIVRGNNSCSSLISCVVIGSSRSKLIYVLRARGSSPADGSSKTRMLGFHGKHGSNGDAFLPACIKKRTIGHLAETTSAVSCTTGDAGGFK